MLSRHTTGAIAGNKTLLTGTAVYGRSTPPGPPQPPPEPGQPTWPTPPGPSGPRIDELAAVQVLRAPESAEAMARLDQAVADLPSGWCPRCMRDLGAPDCCADEQLARLITVPARACGCLLGDDCDCVIVSPAADLRLAGGVR